MFLCWLLRWLVVEVEQVMHCLLSGVTLAGILRGVSWDALQPFTGISLITPSHLLLPRKVVFLSGAGTADVLPPAVLDI